MGIRPLDVTNRKPTPGRHHVASSSRTRTSLREAMEEIKQLRLALDHRTVIGQAQGMLMERLDLDAARAFAYLRRVSNHKNRKLFVVAAEMVDSRALRGGFGCPGDDLS